MVAGQVIVTDVAAVVPTRGDVDLEPVLGHLPFAEIGIWDNSTEEDLGVYGRYVAIDSVDAPVIYTQDDDTLVPIETVEALVAVYEPGMVVCNVPARFRDRYTDSGLLGFGAVFDRDLPRQAFNTLYAAQDAFEDLPGSEPTWHFWRGGERYEIPRSLFRRTCDLVLTMLTPMVQVDLPVTELPVTYAANRMHRQPQHYSEREQMRELCREVRDMVRL